MARKVKKVSKEIIEDLIQKSFRHIGIDVKEDQCNLFLRLFIGIIADYFFNSPDDEIEVGFVKFKKNPEKLELFSVELIPNEEIGIINADTLYRYYTGDLGSAEILKETMDRFINELLIYSQNQSNKITVLTNKMQGRRRENDI